MNIGIIGTGNMGSGLGKIWAKNGHKLMFSYSRDAAKLEKIASEIGSNASVGTPAEAVKFADVVVLSVPYGAVTDALTAAGSIDGKILFSIVNALLPDMSGMAVGTTTSAAEEIAKLSPEARVVEALPVFAEVLNSPSRSFGEQLATVFYTGDDAESKQVVADLLREIDVDPIDSSLKAGARILHSEHGKVPLNLILDVEYNNPKDYADLIKKEIPQSGGYANEQTERDSHKHHAHEHHWLRGSTHPALKKG